MGSIIEIPVDAAEEFIHSLADEVKHKLKGFELSLIFCLLHSLNPWNFGIPCTIGQLVPSVFNLLQIIIS